MEAGSYGQGINLGEANRRAGEGYKAAYARAKQMREQQFANRAADTAPGPAEEVMKETYQVTWSLAERQYRRYKVYLLFSMFSGKIHNNSGAEISIVFLYRGS